jgi:methylated-DNA-[protein]-cysteine S-methyltransferase
MQFQLTYQSPLGNLILRSDGTAIEEVLFAESENQEQKSCDILEKCKAQLMNYFAGTTESFDLELQPKGTPFQQKVWKELLQIPYGETITYFELSKRLGDTKAIRAVGTANGRNPIAIIIPCHRVIGAGNKLTGYAGGIWRKKSLLELEMKNKPSIHTLF